MYLEGNKYLFINTIVERCGAIIVRLIHFACLARTEGQNS